MYQGSLKGVSRKSQESFNEVSRCLNKVSRVFQGRLKGVSFVSRVFERSQREFQRCLEGVSSVF